MNNYIYAVDVGGTDIKAGIIDDSGVAIFQKKAPTLPFDKNNSLAMQIYALLKDLEKTSSLKIEKAVGVGVGIPGLIDTKEGILKYSGNLNLTDYPIGKELAKLLDVKLKFVNDADAATLAEFYYGAGEGSKNFIMVTVGTGIGGGMVIDEKPLCFSRDFTGEITDKKVKCTCEEFGCSETVASTKALVEATKQAMKKNKNSLMWTKYDLDTVSGKTVFEFKDIDPIAKQVFDTFIERLGSEIVNLVNILLPELIVISGAISQQGKALTTPLENYVNSHIFTRHINYKVKIKIAKHTKDAGTIGASCLFKEEK